MARLLNPEIYKALVAAYVERPEEHNYAAKAAGVSHQTAVKAWKDGWADTHRRAYAWAPPIGPRIVQYRRELDEQKRVEAIAAERQAAKFRQEARTDAGETHTQEGVLVKNTRHGVTMLLTIVAKMAPALDLLGQQIVAAVQSNQIDPTKASRVVRDLTAAAGTMTRAGQIAMQMERLYRGDPTSIVGIQETEMTLEEAVAEIEAGQDAVRRLQRGGLEVIEGGAENAEDAGVESQDVPAQA